MEENSTEQKIVAAEVAEDVKPEPVQDLIDYEHFSKIKLRVGQVIEAEPLPKSKKLLKLTVDLGEKLGKRQILAGISQFYTVEQLINHRVVIVANLKPAKLMGLESQGMLLAASNDDDSMVKIVEPNAELPLGSIVR